MLGLHIMKGPDYRPELESDVWERAWNDSLQLLPTPAACIWAALGEEQTDGKVEKEEGRGGGGDMEALGLREDESGMGPCTARRV